jgi:hypothetical protein
MSFAAVLLAPLVLLFPASVIEVRELYEVPAAGMSGNPPRPRPEVAAARQGWGFREVAESFRVRAQNQVRIEQHMTIRITPSRPRAMPPDFLFDFREREAPPRLIERNMGRCLPVASISGVQPDAAGNRLILFLRDRRMVSATLERACRARDFYSGFYVDRTEDGQLCVGRATLLSRSGMNCKLTRLRQLIDPGD